MILGAEILDQFALLKDVGVYDGCLLRLIVSADEGTATSRFEPEEGYDAEMALAVDDRVTVLLDERNTEERRQQNNDRWVYGRNETTGEHGWFPLSHLDVGSPAMPRHRS